MAHLTLRVLGDLQVSVDGVPAVSLESDKVRALLVYLAVEAGRAHRRETLTGLLWPDLPEPTARHNLRQALFNLRLATGDHTAQPPYLLITRDAIQFNRESDCRMDLDQFNACADAWENSRDHEQDGSPSHADRLEEAVELYRGEFLRQFYIEDSEEFDEWLVVQRESLHRRVMQALAWLAGAAEQRGDYPGARRFALRQLELDPWREEAHCQMMRALALDGQRSAALAQYETCRKVLVEALGVEPSAATRDLYEQIRQGALNPQPGPPAQAPSAPIHNLPASLTPFVGREQELAGLGRLIADPQCRCITLVGPGGIGKTRLALEAAAQHKNEFVDGCAFIPLAAVGSTDAAIPAIAQAVNLTFFGPSDPKAQLIHHLREKQLLLVLDNLEQLLAEASPSGTIAGLLVELLQQAPQVRLLVTSREAVSLQGEWLFEVRGLAYPEAGQPDGFDEYSAVTLFVQRARRARPDFALSGADRLAAARLCRMVEGMPLAIELAASWVRVIPPAEIIQEIERSLDFLNAQMRDLPERHRSMRLVFDHSWQILSAEERQVLGRLSVFRGGFQRQAAEQVAGASLPVLSALVNRSLLRSTAAGRYDLHELVRQYAAAKIAENPDELHAVQARHAAYYLGLLEENDARLHSSRLKEAAAALTGEMDNIRAAWEGSIARREFAPIYRVSTTLWYLFELCNWFKEGEATFRKTAQALQASLSGSGTDAAERVMLNAMLAHCGYFQFRLGKGEEAYATLKPCAESLRKDAEPSLAIYSLWYLGTVCWELGKYAEAEETLQESLALAQQHGDRWSEALAAEFLGRVAHDLGEYSRARQYLTRSLELFRQVGGPSMVAHVLGDLGRTEQALGEYRRAEELLREGFELAREINYRCGMGLALDAWGQCACGQANHAQAQAYFSESARLFREIDDTHLLSRLLNHQGLHFLTLEDAAAARSAFTEALELAVEGGLMPCALDALAGLAVLDARHSPSQAMLERVLFILQHPGCPQQARDLASRVRADLESTLPQADIDAARHGAASANLPDLVRQALAQLHPE